jgi:hypothetical protein
MYASVDELLVPLSLNNVSDRDAFGRLLDDISSDFDIELGFSFDGKIHIVWLDSGGRERLWLPAPGADPDKGLTVIEDGTTLEITDYELDPKDGVFLTRLDSDGLPQNWVAGKRIVQVTYVAKSAPGGIRQAVLDESVNAWKGRSAGRSGAVGENGTVYPKAFTPDTRQLLRRLKRRYGNA